MTIRERIMYAHWKKRNRGKASTEDCIVATPCGNRDCVRFCDKHFPEHEESCPVFELSVSAVIERLG